MKFNTHYNHKNSFGEDYKGHRSKTIPNEGMTARQVIERSAVGLPPNGGHVPIYRGDLIYPDFDRLDISEQMDIINNVKKEMRDRANEQYRKGKEVYETNLRNKIIEELKQAQAIKLANETPKPNTE